MIYEKRLVMSHLYYFILGVEMNNFKIDARWLVISLAVVLLQVGLGWVCIQLGTIGGTASPFWLPAGLVVAMSLRLGYGILPAIFIGEVVLGYFFMPGVLWKHLMIGCGNVLEGATIIYLAPRWMNGNDPLASVRNFFTFFSAAVLGSLQNGLLGVSALWLAGYIPLAAFLNVLLNWSIGDLGGVLIVAPLLLALYPFKKSAWRGIMRLEYLMLLCTTVVVSGMVFSPWFNLSAPPLAFLLLPLLIWGAFRFDTSGCALLNAAMMTVVIWGTTHEYGPFASSSATESLMLLQVFTSAMIVTSLLTLIVNRDRQHITQELKLHLEQLEHKVEERTSELKLAFEELEEAHQTVNSSIQYASRIQRAILPPETAIKEMVCDHFVLWKPRDVVGGDIYWCKDWGDGYLLILGDCTGHGVPGAFMTLLSTGALDRAIMETTPGNIEALLQCMHHTLQKTLNQSGERGHSDDGIELGVCYLPADKSKMLFAGARFDLYILEDSGVNVIKGSKSGMGYRGIPYDQRFESHEIEIQKNMTFLLASDGLIDQVGGERKRMFGKRRFKTLLSKVRNKPMPEQADAIHQALIDFQGDEERRDDVGVFGFKVI